MKKLLFLISLSICSINLATDNNDPQKTEEKKQPKSLFKKTLKRLWCNTVNGAIILTCIAPLCAFSSIAQEKSLEAHDCSQNTKNSSAKTTTNDHSIKQLKSTNTENQESLSETFTKEKLDSLTQFKSNMSSIAGPIISLALIGTLKENLYSLEDCGWNFWQK